MKKSLGLIIASIAVSGALLISACGLAGDPVSAERSASSGKSPDMSREEGGEVLQLAVSASTGCPAEVCGLDQYRGCRENACNLSGRMMRGEVWLKTCTRYFREPGGSCVKQVYVKETNKCGYSCYPL